MQSDKRIFDDLSKFLNGVAGTVAGMGREAEAGFRERTREWVARSSTPLSKWRRQRAPRPKS